MNPLYLQMNPQAQPQQPRMNAFQQFMQFRQNFKGDPQQQVQQLLASGKITQAQYDQAVQMTNELYKQFHT